MINECYDRQVETNEVDLSVLETDAVDLPPRLQTEEYSRLVMYSVYCIQMIEPFIKQSMSRTYSLWTDVFHKPRTR